jgi:hypothetical protein
MKRMDQSNVQINTMRRMFSNHDVSENKKTEMKSKLL